MNINDMKELITAISKSEVCDFKYEENGVKLSLSKGTEGVVREYSERKTTNSDSIVDTSLACTEEKEKAVRSPLVGTVYMAPSEDEDAYVSIGDYVKKGQVLAIVEAMKLMNEIESEFEGVVKEICVTNGQPVEFGQKLFVIE